MKYWITFFSQTGSEINYISKQLDRKPDLIITNRTDLIGVNPELLATCQDRFFFIPRKPTLDDYKFAIKKNKKLFEDCIITLHGYLRIVPGELCEQYEIVNGHPGAITLFPELKGFNPQERAYNGGYKIAGSVIHRVTAGVDEGEVIMHEETSIEDLDLDGVYEVLHDLSSDLWTKFLTEKLN